MAANLTDAIGNLTSAIALASKKPLFEKLLKKYHSILHKRKEEGCEEKCLYLNRVGENHYHSAKSVKGDKTIANGNCFFHSMILETRAAFKYKHNFKDICSNDKIVNAIFDINEESLFAIKVLIKHAIFRGELSKHLWIN